MKNFKSLHDCEIDIGKLNVVVGANASGKSNLVEAFRLLKKIYVDKDMNPFTEWWGYNNVVWQRKEELSITIGLLFDIEGFEVYFEITCSGVGGKFQILREVLDIKGYLKFQKDGEWITIKHNADFIKEVIKNVDEYESVYRGFKSRLIKDKNRLINESKIRTDLEQRLLEHELINSHFWEYTRVFSNKMTSKNFYLFKIP
ncbi:MAG: AAA family ATPase, partial [Euryarchaeota archaeon]|nr:AAA family ATPase [Euryarchaeota archaeon]